MKMCRICNLEKDTTEFSVSKRNKDGLYSYCKSCTKLRIKQYHLDTKERKKERELIWRAANPDKVKKMSIKKEYGLSGEEYFKLVNSQNNSCKICGVHRSKLKKDLAVDHCHKTSQIRGLLCNNCNLGLGYFKDNVEYLLNAVRYLDG